ncbi:MAG: hypothetical protein ACTSXM_09735 [Promethearchaeota archaeon]
MIFPPKATLNLPTRPSSYLSKLRLIGIPIKFRLCKRVAERYGECVGLSYSLD